MTQRAADLLLAAFVAVGLLAWALALQGCASDCAATRDGPCAVLPKL
jgi:hypothetical protein